MIAPRSSWRQRLPAAWAVVGGANINDHAVRNAKIAVHFLFAWYDPARLQVGAVGSLWGGGLGGGAYGGFRCGDLTLVHLLTLVY